MNFHFAPGAIANRHGDIYGTSPFRVIRHGMVSLQVEFAGAACMMGWRPVEHKREDLDPAFACIERAPEDRPE